MVTLKIIFVITVFHLVPTEFCKYSFPGNFQFGVISSSYQTEGAWNEDGKGENNWDYYLHNKPDLVNDKTNGDIACDSYHKWKEDVQLIKKLGVNFYRFSISWSRILPLGTKGSRINKKGVDFYSNLIDELISEGIEPTVTIYHWDLPQPLQRKGGWLNATIIDDYVYYAGLLFELYGDRVKHWITFNEFSLFCEAGYSGGTSAPFLKLAGVGGYQCTHNALLAHGITYRFYEKVYKKIQKGKVGLVEIAFWGEPKTGSDSDKQASENFMQFIYGHYMHPIFVGNYPPIMIKRIDKLSKAQGYPTSRLPKFTPKEIQIINGSADFLGLNHYSTWLCTFDDNLTQPSLKHDSGVGTSVDPAWKGSAVRWVKYVPWGLRKVLVWIKENYGNPPVLIGENGWPAKDVGLNDPDRVQYLKGYLSELLKAIYEDNCNVFGYTYWSLLDSFEWLDGYTLHFGMVNVDFQSPKRTRTPKKSYDVYRKIISSKRL